VHPPICASRRAEVHAGDEVVIKGRAFFDGCQDSGSCGCTGCEYDDPETPTQTIELSLKRVDAQRTPVAAGSDAELYVLTEVSADSKFKFETRVAVPDLKPGRYRLLADGNRYGRSYLKIEAESGQKK
jgi:hypothetical protein